MDWCVAQPKRLNCTLKVVKTNNTYHAQVQMVNPMSYPVSFSIRAGTPERWEVSPSMLTLEARQSTLVELKLRISKPLPRARKSEYKGIVVFYSSVVASTHQFSQPLKCTLTLFET